MFLISFLALTYSIFNFFKTLFRFEFSIKFSRKLCITWKWKIIFFLWPYGEFSDIKSSNCNPMDYFEKKILLRYFFKWKCSNLRCAVGSIPILITPIGYELSTVNLLKIYTSPPAPCLLCDLVMHRVSWRVQLLDHRSKLPTATIDFHAGLALKSDKRNLSDWFCTRH